MLGVSQRVGLPCRADLYCDFVAQRASMSSDYAVLCAAAADRDAHELAVHGFVFIPPAERPPTEPGHPAGGQHASARTRRWAKGAS